MDQEVTAKPDSIELSSSIPPQIKARHRRQRTERILLLLTVVVVLSAWVYGFLTTGTDALLLVPDVLPGASTVERQGELYIGRDEQGELVGYAATGEAPGYAGPITMLVGVAQDGEILGTIIVSQGESQGFFRLIESENFIEQYPGKIVGQQLQINQDLDAVTGATISAEGIALSVREAARQISADALDQPLRPEERNIKFGWPEISILLLYAIGYMGQKISNRKRKKQLRWGTLLTGLVVIGFIYTIPFTITLVISFISGYWPDWHSSLYWYFLIGGILFVTTVDGKNPYCSWFCPFGAFQETLARITSAKHFRPRDWNDALTWIQRGLALAAVVLGLLLRRPGVAGYEPFATLFDLRGTPVEWIFLIIIIFSSLLMYRPFCNLLCPLDPIFDFIAAFRRWIKDLRRGWRKEEVKA